MDSGGETQSGLNLTNLTHPSSTPVPQSEPETLLTECTALKKQSARRHPCKVTGCPVACSQLRRHFIRSHVPWYAFPFTACWNCDVQESSQCFLIHGHGEDTDTHPSGARFNSFSAHRWGFLMNGVFSFFCKHLGVESIPALLLYVQEHRLFPQSPSQLRNVDFSDAERMLMFRYEHDNESEPLCDLFGFSVNPPNRVVCLSHWQILAALVSRLSPEARLLLLQSRESLLQTGEGFIPDVQYFPEAPIHFMDTHFHLDALLSKTSQSSLESVELLTPVAEQFSLTLAVANYVFPNSWQKLPWQPGSDSRVVFTAGVHPHFASKVQNVSDVCNSVRSFLNSPRCVGVGEIGLDETSDASVQANQVQIFSALAPLALEQQKTLVLHCRGSTASQRVLQLLRDLGLTGLKIHLHCFSESFAVAQEWISACPHICFGFGTPVLTNPEVADTVMRLPLQKLLLESDAPYQPIFPEKVTTPWSLLPVAGKVAMLRNMPLPDLVYFCSSNTRYIYSLWRLFPDL